MSYTDWASVISKYQPLIQQRTAARLEKAQQLLIRTRSDTLKAMYTAHLKTLPPVEWDALPRGRVFLELPEVESILRSPADVLITDATFAELMTTLPTMVDAWRQAMKSSLGNLIDNAGGLPISAHGSVSKPGIDCVHLAIAIFRCVRDQSDYFPHCPCYNKRVISLDGALRYECWDCPNKLAFDKDASKAMASVVHLARLDPSTATADDMEKLDLKFVCSHCTSGHYPLVYDWRGTVRSVILDIYSRFS